MRSFGSRRSTSDHERLQLLSHRHAEEGAHVVVETLASELVVKVDDASATSAGGDLKGAFQCGGGVRVHTAKHMAQRSR